MKGSEILGVAEQGRSYGFALIHIGHGSLDDDAARLAEAVGTENTSDFVGRIISNSINGAHPFNNPAKDDSTLLQVAGGNPINNRI